ncbi:SCF ubiquitin ligase complex subunit cdc4 [Phlyctochytrium planicorne]|nr:SCF ubiquitin ligase complex subunit cdc4 [Phlyctochytrium planicorne]
MDSIHCEDSPTALHPLCANDSLEAGLPFDSTELSPLSEDSSTNITAASATPKASLLTKAVQQQQVGQWSLAGLNSPLAPLTPFPEAGKAAVTTSLSEEECDLDDGDNVARAAEGLGDAETVQATHESSAPITTPTPVTTQPATGIPTPSHTRPKASMFNLSLLDVSLSPTPAGSVVSASSGYSRIGASGSDGPGSATSHDNEEVSSVVSSSPVLDDLEVGNEDVSSSSSSTSASSAPALTAPPLTVNTAVAPAADAHELNSNANLPSPILSPTAANGVPQELTPPPAPPPPPPPRPSVMAISPSTKVKKGTSDADAVFERRPRASSADWKDIQFTSSPKQISLFPNSTSISSAPSALLHSNSRMQIPTQHLPLPEDVRTQLLPAMQSMFDPLPSRVQAHVILHLLNRLTSGNLQFVSSMILPALKRDFLGLLPLELGYHILEYLDLRSLGRCGQVSKVWRRVVDGEGAEVAVWKRRLVREGWFDTEEVNKEEDRQRKEAHDILEAEEAAKFDLILRENAAREAAKRKGKERETVPSVFFNHVHEERPLESSICGVVDCITCRGGVDKSRNGTSAASSCDGVEEEEEEEATWADGVEESVETKKCLRVEEEEDGEDEDEAVSALSCFCDASAEGGSCSCFGNQADANSGVASNSGSVLDGSTYGIVDESSSALTVDSEDPPLPYFPPGTPFEVVFRELDKLPKRKGRRDAIRLPPPKAPTPPVYKKLYRRHFATRQNWVHGRCKTISFPGHGTNVVTCLQFDDDKIVSGSDDTTIHVYDVNNGKLLKKLEGHEGGVWALQYWNNTLVSGSTDRTVRVWDLETGRCTHVFEGHTSTVRCLMIVTPTVISPPPNKYGHVQPSSTQTTDIPCPLIVTGSRDATLRVWRLPDPHFVLYGLETRDNLPLNGAPYFMHVLSGHTNSVRAIAGHGRVLVSGSYDTTVRVWDLVTGENVHCFRGHREKVYSVGYCHELRRAVSGSMDATVRVWCTRTGASLFCLEGHSSLVGLLELSPTYLVSAAADATLRIWCPTTGQCLATLTGHAAAITCFHHDPKLNRIVSGSDGGVKVWELSSAPHASAAAAAAAAAAANQRSDGSLPSMSHSATAGTVGTPPPVSMADFLSTSAAASLQGAAGVGGGPGFAFTQGPNGPQPVHGRFVKDLVNNIQGVWRVRMDERRMVSAIQKERGRTWFEILDFGEGVEAGGRIDGPGDGEEPEEGWVPEADLEDAGEQQADLADAVEGQQEDGEAGLGQEEFVTLPGSVLSTLVNGLPSSVTQADLASHMATHLQHHMAAASASGSTSNQNPLMSHHHHHHHHHQHPHHAAASTRNAFFRQQQQQLDDHHRHHHHHHHLVHHHHQHLHHHHAAASSSAAHVPTSGGVASTNPSQQVPGSILEFFDSFPSMVVEQPSSQPSSSSQQEDDLAPRRGLQRKNIPSAIVATSEDSAQSHAEAASTTGQVLEPLPFSLGPQPGSQDTPTPSSGLGSVSMSRQIQQMPTARQSATVVGDSGSAVAGGLGPFGYGPLFRTPPAGPPSFRPVAVPTSRSSKGSFSISSTSANVPSTFSFGNLGIGLFGSTSSAADTSRAASAVSPSASAANEDSTASGAARADIEQSGSRTSEGSEMVQAKPSSIPKPSKSSSVGNGGRGNATGMTSTPGSTSGASGPTLMPLSGDERLSQAAPAAENTGAAENTEEEGAQHDVE